MNTSHLDLLRLLGRDTTLKRVTNSNGGEYAGPCPWCGGRDRFRVWPHDKWPHYWCRQCGRRGDAIQYLRDFNNLTFSQACQMLGLSSSEISPTGPRTCPGRSPAMVENNWRAFSDPGWQSAARDFLVWAQGMLHSSKGKRGRDYLHERGLTDSVIEGACLGYNPQRRKERWGATWVELVPGIVIPWVEKVESRRDPPQACDRIWKVNLRRLDKKLPKYQAANGSANGLYGVSSIFHNAVVVMVEGEFCALSLQVAAPQVAIPVATGSITNARLHRWIGHLSLASRIVVAFDAEDKADAAAIWWQEAFPDTAILLRPTRHDVNDMLMAGDDITSWLSSVL